MAQISAKKIIEGAKKAQPYNILRLADPEIYEKVPYYEFKAEIIGHPKQEALGQLLENVVKMENEVYHRADKIYVYFILSLSAILGEY